ncbi:histidine--tRNA ligase [Candidatus Falkowbacteria bacterium]|nr:histidine--tRNA ligase [Candidatus Falkowbacteria bacterium]
MSQEPHDIADDGEKKNRSKKDIQLLRGFKDILPADQGPVQYLQTKATELAKFYGFGKIDTPLLEMTSLFRRSVGDVTDIVEKEMYTFTDAGGDSVSLRPEITASVVRAYNEHGMLNLPQPVKVFYWGSCFRYDRPQTGRYRQFNQFGLETIGEMNPAVDAEIILLSYLFLKEIGLKVEMQVNSIGCPNCRPEYKKNLIAYYRRKKRNLCGDCQRRLLKNPLRLLDCKEEGCQELKSEAPQIVDWLCEECKNHFMRVLEYLDALSIPYNLNSFLVRGLDYYTKTVFEILPVAPDDQPERRQSALGGGGRYDGLSAVISGKEAPGCGVSIGIERLVIEMRKQSVEPPAKKGPQVFLAQIGEQAKQRGFQLLEEFRKEKMAVGQMFAKDSLKSQLELADKMGVKYVLILGQKEVLEGTILMRDMEGGVQENVDLDRVVTEIKKKLKDGKIRSV